MPPIEGTQFVAVQVGAVTSECNRSLWAQRAPRLSLPRPARASRNSAMEPALCPAYGPWAKAAQNWNRSVNWPPRELLWKARSGRRKIALPGMSMLVSAAAVRLRRLATLGNPAVYCGWLNAL